MDYLEDVRKLRDAIQRKAEELNLNVAGFSLLPGQTSEDTDIVQVAFFLTPEAVETLEETEQRAIDAEFDALFKSNFGDSDMFAGDETKALKEKQKKQEEDAKNSLKDLLDEIDEQ